MKLHPCFSMSRLYIPGESRACVVISQYGLFYYLYYCLLLKGYLSKLIINTNIYGLTLIENKPACVLECLEESHESKVLVLFHACEKGYWISLSRFFVPAVYGENIIISTEDLSADETVDKWAAEEEDYDYGKARWQKGKYWSIHSFRG